MITKRDENKVLAPSQVNLSSGKSHPPLFGSRDAARYLGLSYAEFQSHRRRKDFPEPDYYIRKGSKQTIWCFWSLTTLQKEKQRMVKAVKAVEITSDKVVKTNYPTIQQNKQEISKKQDKTSLLHTTDANGRTPLFCAVIAGKIDSVRLLLEAGSPVNATTKNGDTCLMMARSRSFHEIEDLLRQYGADPTLKNQFGETVDSFLPMTHHDCVLGM